MATTGTPQVQSWHPRSTRILALVVGAAVLAFAALGTALVLSDGADEAATTATVAGASGSLGAAGLATDIDVLQSRAVPGSVAPAANVPGYVAEHNAGVDAALAAFGEDSVAPYIAEHDRMIDAMLRYELTEDIGPAPYIEEHNRLIDAILGGS